MPPLRKKSGLYEEVRSLSTLFQGARPKGRNSRCQKGKLVRTMTNYPIGDFLIRIGNAALAKSGEVRMPSTKFIHDVAKALEKSGYLSEVKKEKGIIVVKLAIKRKEPVIMRLKLVSRPGLRIYLGADELGKKRGPSKFLLTTPKGIMMSDAAIKNHLGGEVIAEIW